MIEPITYTWGTVYDRSLAIGRLEVKIATLLNQDHKNNKKILNEIKMHLNEISQNNYIIWEISLVNKEKEK